MSSIASALFELPPFPQARPHPVVRAAPGAPAGGSAQAFIAAWRTHGYAPGFWRAPDDAPPHDAATARLLGDLATPGDAAREAALHAEVERLLLRDHSYHDPFTGEPTTPAALIGTLAGWQALVAANRPIAAAFGFAHWKRDTVDPLLWGGRPVPFRPARIAELERLPADALVAVWKGRVPATFLDRLEHGPWRVLEVEDGFIRSVGLGADCVPPLSIVADDLGIHYDCRRASRLEQMLAQGHFPPEELDRARRLRDRLVREGISKYGVGAGTALPRPGGEGQRHILVVGQVEDDRSVRFGSPEVRSNLELLRRVRAMAPDAFLVYRPHPDVEAGHRRGAIPREAALDIADQVDSASPISALIGMVDEVHVISSLAGFEALLQGKPVTAHGMPFFAGWGLTRDLVAVPARRGAKRTVEQLVAATLLQYPRYLDPVTNLPCTAEILVRQIVSGARRQNAALVWLRRLQGKLAELVKYFTGAR